MNLLHALKKHLWPKLLYLWCRKVYSERTQTDLHLTLTTVLTNVNLNELNLDLTRTIDDVGNPSSKLETFLGYGNVLEKGWNRGSWVFKKVLCIFPEVFPSSQYIFPSSKRCFQVQIELKANWFEVGNKFAHGNIVVKISTVSFRISCFRAMFPSLNKCFQLQNQLWI